MFGQRVLPRFNYQRVNLLECHPRQSCKLLSEFSRIVLQIGIFASPLLRPAIVLMLSVRYRTIAGIEQRHTMKKIQPCFDLYAMSIFLQVARDGSLTAAAKKSFLTQSAVSKAISRLEAKLGVPLLKRSPRSVTLTPEGVQFFDEGERLTLAVERVLNVVRAKREDTPKRLRVVLPIHFGRIIVAPKLPAYLARHRTVKLEYMLFENGEIDPVAADFDIGMIIGSEAHASNANYCYEYIAGQSMVLCATAAYLDNNGVPQSISDLDSLAILGALDRSHASNKTLPWTFNVKGSRVRHLPRFNFLTNSIEVLLSMAESGIGLALLPEYVARESLASGKLKQVLADYAFEPLAIQIFYKRSRSQDDELQEFIRVLRDAIPLRRLRAMRSRKTKRR
jgi:DNA-binding transcriptional LysR family regulator